MKIYSSKSFFCLFTVFLCMPAFAKTPEKSADFKEVYELLSTNLLNVKEADLEQAALRGLLNELKGKVSVVKDSELEKSAPQKAVEKSAMFDGPIAYVRIGKIQDGVAKETLNAIKQFNSTNKISGVALDLRFAHGDNYSAAAQIADLFLSKEQPLIDWGDGSARSKEKSDAISVPVAVLVNHDTRKAAEALAAVLRDSGRALILGTNTAGEAVISKKFTLSNGQELRIATAPIKVGKSTALSTSGLKPDITVSISKEDELAYLEDPFKELESAQTQLASELSATAAGTNRPPRRRINEAELLRERSEGRDSAATDTASLDQEPERPVVQDPVLARSLDLLKGLAVVRQSRSR